MQNIKIAHKIVCVPGETQSKLKYNIEKSVRKIMKLFLKLKQ